MTLEIRPFEIDIGDSEIADLHHRLQRTRWPEAEVVADWSQGIPLAYLQDVCEYWATGYDWNRCQTRLNSKPNYLTSIDGLDIHFQHIRSPHSGALPMIITHGWPGSVVEFQKVIDPLTDPTSHGGGCSRCLPPRAAFAAGLRVESEAVEVGNRGGADRGHVERADGAPRL